MQKTYNKTWRQQCLSELENTSPDLIIIGGGVTGAGIALDAVSRGLNTLLLEKSDFASGTSSKSTKLIHGGLRYLKQLEIGLVRETGRERAQVHKLVPHLVHPENMFLPILVGGSFGKWSASMAISVYDYLADVSKEDKKNTLNRTQALKAEPLLKKDLVKSGIIYSEYRTDDARLTIELIKKAQSLGAQCLNYCHVDELRYSSEKKLAGLVFTDTIDDVVYEVKCDRIVSATGPWVDELREKDHSITDKSIRQTKGVHLVFDREAFPVSQSIYFDDFEGRMLFAIPRGDVVYVGTTDTDYSGDPDRVLCSSEDVNYILEAVKNVFQVHLGESDILSTWAGLRPLIQESGKSASEVSRRDEIFISPSGLISIAGGKLTGYRKMAERVVDTVLKESGIEHKPCHTDKLPLGESPFDSYDEVKAYIDTLSQDESLGIDRETVRYLVHNYGKASREMLTMAAKDNQSKSLDEALVKQEVKYALVYELAMKPDDFFNRRSGMLYFKPHRLKKHFDLILSLFRSYHQWSEKDYIQEQKEAEQCLRDSWAAWT